jgi:DNA-binding MarR family transcriptional regulator
MRASLAMARAMERDAEATGRLPFLEHHLLATLGEGPPAGMRPTELADRAALTKSGLTRAMDRLEAQRLVERRADPSDGRAQLVVLTPAGRRTLRRFAPEHFRSIARRFADHLSEHEVVVLTNALERVAAAARSA